MLLRRYSLPAVRRQWGLFGLLFLGLAVAFSLFTAMRLANVTVLREFRGAVESLVGASPFQIVSSTRYFNADEIVPLLLKMESLESILPIRVDEAEVVASDGKGVRITLIGVDMTHDRVSEINPGSSGDAPTEGNGLRFLQYHSLVSASGLRDLAIGNTLVFRDALGRNRAIDVSFQEEGSERGSSGGLLGLHGGQVAVGDLSLVDDLLGNPGRLSEISLYPRMGISENDLITEVSALLPPHLLLSFPDERFQSVSETSAALRMNLLFLGALSLFVGALLGFQVMRLLLLRREGDHAVLLSLGLSPRFLGVLLLLESAVIGGLSGLLGGVLGSGFGISLVGAVQKTISHLYEPLYEQPLILDLGILLEGVLVGVVVGIVAGGLALKRLISSQSLVRGRELQFVQSAKGPSRKYALVGVGVLACGLLGTSKGLLMHPVLLPLGVTPFFAPCAISLAALLIAPHLVWYGSNLLIVICRRLGWDVVTLLALDGIKVRIRDAGIAVAALGIAFGMLLGIVTMISGFQATFEEWLEKVLRADLYLSFPAGRTTAENDQEMLARQLREHSAVSGVHVGKEQRYEYRGRQIFVRQSDIALLHREDALVILSNDPIDFDRVYAGEGVFVTEPFCNRFQCTIGEKLTFPVARPAEEDSANFLKGQYESFFIAGVLQDFSTDLGAVLLPPKKYTNLFGQEGRPTGLSVYVREGDSSRSLIELREMLRKRYGPRITVRDRATLTKEALRVFHETFSVTYVLQVLSLLISSLFLVLELIASILYRKRERLTLQSFGAPLSFLKRIVVVEALTIAGAATLLGLLIGAILSWILVYRVNVLFFGWTIGLTIPLLDTALYVVGFFLLSAMLAWGTVHLLFQSISSEELHYE